MRTPGEFHQHYYYVTMYRIQKFPVDRGGGLSFPYYAMPYSILNEFANIQRKSLLEAEDVQ
jgi:hypothetical protein